MHAMHIIELLNVKLFRLFRGRIYQPCAGCRSMLVKPLAPRSELPESLHRMLVLSAVLTRCRRRGKQYGVLKL
jgi:hypothetical protein